MSDRTEREFVIGSRGSRLALWQAEWVQKRLIEFYPGIKVRIEIIKTTGDVLRSAPLAVIGGRGVFTKELEEALLDGRIDIAVHSLKDLPTSLTEALHMAAITEREDARDALLLRSDIEIEHPSIDALPHGAVVGTSSPRRLAQLKHPRPDLNIKELRGNVDTRLRKLDAGDYDAIILAAAGLHRLGFAHRISAYIALETMLPAVGQGALGVETRRDDVLTINLVEALNHPPTHAVCIAERALLRALGGGCQLPIAAHAHWQHDELQLEGLVAETDGHRIIRGVLSGQGVDAVQLGETLAAKLLQEGAATLLAEAVL